MPPNAQPQVRYTNLQDIDELRGRIASIEAAISSISAQIPPSLVQDIVALRSRIEAIEQQEDPLEPMPQGDDISLSYPFRLYLSGDEVLCQSGIHVWWNQYTQAIAYTTLVEDGTNNWAPTASTIYVERLANADGTATVTLNRTTDAVNVVLGGIADNKARWIIGTISSSGVISQSYTAGDIYELRVS